MINGYVSLLLHAHLPFVRNSGYDDSLEERWFFESCTECYIPLLNSLERLICDGVNYRLTISLSPTLLSMMSDDLLKEKYLLYLDRLIALGQSECDRTGGNKKLNVLSVKYLRHLEDVRRYFYGCGGNLPLKFKHIYDKGRVELITTSATHGFMPLIHNRESRRAQIEVGLELFEKFFGKRPPGFWIPECAYTEGVDELLREAGVKYFIVDTHGLLSASPEPVYGIYGPVLCRSGVAAFGRDPQSSRQVWERREGYPGHQDYREFYRDIAYDLDIDYLRPYLPGGCLRVDTGFKYYSITGQGDHKEVYNPEAAARRVGIHARDFVTARSLQLKQASERMDRAPMVLSPYDAELFGHWWYEGPSWLEQVFRQAAMDGGVKTISPGDYLSLYPSNQVVEMPMSTWGEGGYSFVWLNPKNDWIYKHQHFSESKMTEMVDLLRPAEGILKRALNQAGRELLLAQSSDWAFILKEQTTVEYAEKRVTDHLNNFIDLAGQIEAGSVEEMYLEELEGKNNIFPHLDYRSFASVRVRPGVYREHRKRIIMLSWEYPPRSVGGLGRHVYELSRALAGLGIEVHVFTCPARDRPPYGVDRKGVHVHRVEGGELNTGNFLEWLNRLNLGMIRLAEQSGLSSGYFDLVHAHDWLVCDAAREIAQKGNLPLIVTIHATEYGRNRGIVTDLQRKIHGIEGELVALSNRLICCSEYMAREVGRLFGQGQGGIKVIPNGVDIGNITEKHEIGPGTAAGAPKIAFLGRLVPEKGVQVLIGALPLIKKSHPSVVLAVAGTGPYEEELKKLAYNLGVADSVQFIGFVDDYGRNRLLAEAAVAVFPSIYEPFGIVALEAMAAGTPVVVSETGGLSEIITHGIDGIKVPPGRSDILARYVIELLAHPSQAEKLRKNAYRKVLGRYNWDQIALDTGRLYLDVTGKTASLLRGWCGI
ncbi:MAG: 1,4-alpha-glucan branching protein domain-containing protein [Desulfocucumaceae bacterium]